MKMFKTILKPFDSQVMVPYEYISTDVYASKKKVKSDGNLLRTKLAFSSNACHMAQKKEVTWKPFFSRGQSP